MDSSKNHMIVEDGYNRGRNYIVERATRGSRWKGMWWKADVEWREGLLQRGKHGVFYCLRCALAVHVRMLIGIPCMT